eukprot:883960_1
MATDTTTTSTNTKKQDENKDAYIGQPLDRKGKTLTDDQAIIFNRYNKWKNNLMCLYNHIESYALPYPARTVQFIPNPKQNISSENQYPRYTNCPFIYPSHTTVPKQNQQISTNTDNSNGINEQTHRLPKRCMTPIY